MQVLVLLFVDRQMISVSVQFHHDIYFDDKRYRAQIWNWLKY